MNVTAGGTYSDHCAVHIVTTGLYGVKASGLQVLEYVVQGRMGGKGGSIFRRRRFVLNNRSVVMKQWHFIQQGYLAILGQLMSLHCDS